MNKDDLNMDKTFREKLDGFSSSPPPYVWNNIQGEMLGIKRKKRKLMLGWIAAAAVVVMAFLAGWLFNNSSDEISPFSAENKTANPIINEREKLIEPERNTSNFSIEQENNSEANTTLVASANPQKEVLFKQSADKSVKKQDSNAGNSSTQRVKMDFVKSLSAFFEINHQNSDKLESIKKDSKRVEWLESDKNLVASNIENYRNNKQEEALWKIGIHAAPAYSSHNASHSENYAQNMTYSGSNGNANVGGGFSVQYKTSKKWSLESGLYYAKSGQSSQPTFQLFAFSNKMDYAYAGVAPEKSFMGNAVNVSNGEMTMNSTAGIIALNGTPRGAEISSDFESAIRGDYSNTLLSNGEFSQVFDFVEIPVYLRYNVIDAQIGVEILGGLNAGLVVGNNAFIDNEYGLQNIGKTEEISTVNLSGMLGFAVNYALGKHVSLALEPRFNYYLNSINTNPDVDFRPYRLGVYTGIYYEF